MSFDVPNPGSPEIEARISAIAPFVRFALSDLPDGFNRAGDSRAQVPRIASLSLVVLGPTRAAGTAPDLAPSPGNSVEGVFLYDGVDHLRKSLDKEILPRVLGNEPILPPEPGYPPQRSISRLSEGRLKASRPEET